MNVCKVASRIRLPAFLYIYQPMPFCLAAQAVFLSCFYFCRYFLPFTITMPL